MNEDEFAELFLTDVAEITPEHMTQMEENLRRANDMTDHLVNAVREHKAQHNQAEPCLAFCPGNHLAFDVHHLIRSALDEDDDTSADALAKITGLLMVMTTRLAGYDTD